MMRVALAITKKKKIHCSTTSLLRTRRPQTFKLVFLEKVILQLQLFKNLRQYARLRRTIKWNKKVFIEVFLGTVIVNA